MPAGADNGPYCKRGDNVHDYVQASPRSRRQLLVAPVEQTPSHGCAVLNATLMCGAFAARVELAGLHGTIVDAVSGAFEHISDEPGSHHVLGAWLWQQAGPLHTSISAMKELIREANYESKGSLARTNAPMHSFMWHALARTPRDDFAATALDLCPSNGDDCTHGAGHGALLNALLRADTALAGCYSACTPLRPKQGLRLGAQTVQEALAMCASFVALDEGCEEGGFKCKETVVLQPRASCESGVYHSAMNLMLPTSIMDLMSLCALPPLSGHTYLFPSADICFMHLHS